MTTTPRPLSQQPLGRLPSGPRAPVDARTTGFRNLAIIAFIAGFVLLLYLGIDTILQTQDADAETIAELSYSADEIGFFDSYAATAFIYAQLSSLMRDALVYLVALGFLLIFLWNIRGVIILAFASFLLIAPLLLFLTLFTKETILMPFLFLTFGAVMVLRTNYSRFAAVACLYIFYGIFFRQYFLLIAMVVGYLLAMSSLSTGKRLIFLILVILCMFVVPTEVYRSLNEARDYVNYMRIGYADAGYRTAFINFTGDATPVGFILNYGYALIRLNFPLFFDIGPKEAFLMVNSIAYFALIFVGVKYGDQRTKAASLIFLSHIAILTIFEPDLGSYLRHAGTALIFLAPSLWTLDRLIAARQGTYDPKGMLGNSTRHPRNERVAAPRTART